jgi:nucleolar GTP-binding protein
MFKIPKIEDAQFYFSKSMKEMEEMAIKQRDQIGERFTRSKGTAKKNPDLMRLDMRKDLELYKIRYLNETLNRKLRKVKSFFPRFQKTQDIYLKLIDTCLSPVQEIEKALEDIESLLMELDELTQKSEHKIKKAKSQQTVQFIMQKYLGKLNKNVEKREGSFSVLKDARDFMNQLPSFKDIYTLCIAGFPNVGKSTLMKKISGSDVEIQNYPFTTKGLMFSYLEHKGLDLVQLIDTPGLLDREKTNSIEERAQIVISEYCQSIIFVLDITESCGYKLDKQLKLLQKTKALEKPFVLYLSKTDIFTEKEKKLEKELRKKELKEEKIYTDSEELKKILIEEAVEEQKKNFSVKKLKRI